jgi:hypothetical protein
MNRWRLITDPPPEGVEKDVVFFRANAVVLDAMTGEPVNGLPAREFCDLGYWDGSAWFYNGSNHPVFEFNEPGEDDQDTTHYAPLLAPPPRNAA